MNGKYTLLLLLFFAQVNLTIIAMQNAQEHLRLPLLVENKSNYVVTLLHYRYKPSPSHLQLNLLRKGERYPNPDWHGPLELDDIYSIRIITSVGHFSLVLARTGQNAPAIDLDLATVDEQKWKDNITKIPLAGLIKLTARVKEDGMVKLIQHKESPQDGRPDVSLLAYEELLGAQMYASAEQILGIAPGVSVKEAYEKRIAEFCEHYIPCSESEGIKLLLHWAAKKLGAE